MAARSQWKGYLKLSLVSIPVKAYSATTSSTIRLNQLHAECNSRVKHVKTCPVHGVIPNDEIVAGYEFSKGQYVIIDTDELDKLRTEDDKAVKIDAFVAPATLDEVHYTDRHYYLVPEGSVGQRAFAVLAQAMAEEEKYAVATVVMHGKEQLVLLRSHAGLLVMTVLYHNSEVSSPSAFEDEIPKEQPTPEEMNLAKMLVKTQTPKKFDFGQYKDVYSEKLTKLIEAKVSGEELVAPPATEHVQVINLMDALRQSVERAQKSTGSEAGDVKEPRAAQEEKPAKPAKPPRKMAPSKGTKAAETRKRKSS